MLPYWILFAYFALGSTLDRLDRARARSAPILAAGVFGMALMIGLRFEVGGDWKSYYFMFRYAGYRSLERTLQIGDPGYQLLNWTVRAVDIDIWLVNLVCAFIFCWGLIRFAKAQPERWLSIVVAIPYMVIVVAMGYSRQAVALGIAMAAVAAIKRNSSVTKFALWISVAALFHKSAVVLFPLVALSKQRDKLINVLIALATGFLLYDLFLAESLEGFVSGYLTTRYSSQGAAIRVVMNLVPALLFFILGRRLGFEDEERPLWRNFALAALMMVVLLVVSPSSTAVDRVSIYLMPLQIAILSRIPIIFKVRWHGRAVVITYSGLVQYVWLNYATHAQFWLPYQVYPL